MTTARLDSSTVSAHGATLYFEQRGEGPTVLLIPGATGDAGHFAEVADRLADDFTVVTYDRRGNSRSPRPDRWTATSMAEQADDAAALIEALELQPCAVFGTSGGAVIALELVRRRPDLLRRLVVHEPPLLAVVPNGAQIGAELEALATHEIEQGGPPAAMELFVRKSAGDATFERLDPEMRERMLGNGELFFTLEIEPLTAYIPDVEAVANADVAIVVLAGVGSRGQYYHDAARWVADAVGAPLVEIAGAHTPYWTDPTALSASLRQVLGAGI